MAELTSGMRYGEYELINRLHTGGEAEIWKASTTNSTSEVALRFLKSQYNNTHAVKRHFDREVETHRLLNGHPHIIPLLSSNWNPEHPYLVMPYVPGGSLKKVLKDLEQKHERLPPPEALTYIKQTAEALSYAHERDIIHRDVNPANMLLGDDGILLIDFGLAINMETTYTRIWGTPKYQLPEKEMSNPVQASDQYTLAITMCKLFTGKFPDEGGKEDLQAKFLKIFKIFMRASDQNPNERFPSMKEFANELEQLKASDLLENEQTQPPLPIEDDEELTLWPQEDFLQQFCVGASVDGFDSAKVQEYANLQQDSDHLPKQTIQDLCRGLGLTSKRYTPRRSAVLAFHRMPSRHLPSALVRVTVSGLSSEQPYFRKNIEGPLSDQAERTHRLVTERLITVSENPGGQRLDRCEIPERALRELIVNALLHRNYNAPESVQIEIKPRQVIITNPGRLDEEIEHLESPFSYQNSHPQNPILLRMLEAQQWAEGRALGFKIIREEFEKYKLPLPEIHNLPNGLVQVVIKRPQLSTIFHVDEKVPDVIETVVTETPQKVGNVPYPHSRYSIGRNELLTRIATELKPDQTTGLSRPVAICGLGAIGKTEIAIQYAYQHHQNYQAVLWTLADTREALISGYIGIADLLKLPEKDEQDQTVIVKAVKDWLQTNTGWLLILDHINDPTVVPDFLPPTLNGHLLLTTRLQTIGIPTNRIEVDTIPPNVGIPFLRQCASDAPLKDATNADITTAREIYTELRGLPLALDLAGAYIKETPCSLSDYQKLYRIRRTELLQRRGGLVHDYVGPVAISWSLSFEKVAQKDPAATDLLHFCTFLHPDAIPEEMLTAGAKHLGSQLQSLATDPLSLNNAIEVLEAHSLIRHDKTEKMWSIDRLLQAVLKDTMDASTQRAWTKKAVLAVNEAFPSSVEFTTWYQCERYLAQALNCTALIEQENPISQETASLLNRIEMYLGERRRSNEREQLLVRALFGREQQLGRLHPDIAINLNNNLADLYYNQGKYEQAEQLYLRVLRIREQQLGPEHTDTVISLNNLASLYYNQGKYGQAEQLYLRVLRIWEQQLGHLHPDIAINLNNLAYLYHTQRKFKQAEPLYRRALTIDEKAYGSEHPKVANDLNNLALLYHNQAKYRQAEPLYQRALAIRTRQLGPLHPETVQILKNLAALYHQQRKYEQAEQMYQQVLAIREQQPGPFLPDTVQILNSMAALYHEQGRHNQAEQSYLQALALAEKQLGPQHPNTEGLRRDYISFLQAMRPEK